MISWLLRPAHPLIGYGRPFTGGQPTA